MAINSLRFDIQATDPLGKVCSVEVIVREPVCEPDAFRWACAASWSGLGERTITIYGITSFQALRLTLDFLEVVIPAHLPQCSFQHGGLPWPTPRIP